MQIEASRDSNLKLLGPTFPIEAKHGHVMIQLGTGFLAPPAFKGSSGAVETTSLDFVPVGLQLRGLWTGSNRTIMVAAVRSMLACSLDTAGHAYEVADSPHQSRSLAA